MKNRLLLTALLAFSVMVFISCNKEKIPPPATAKQTSADNSSKTSNSSASTSSSESTNNNHPSGCSHGDGG